MSNTLNSADISENIRVYLRQRPNIFGESKNGGTSNKLSGVETVSNDHKKCSYYSSMNNTSQDFKMDHIFTEDSGQEELYINIAKPLVESALQGYSSTIIAYGPTCSGKTFTMRGGDNALKGIMPRCVEHLLGSIIGSTITMWASYMQIYCEGVTDLLTTSSPPESADQSLIPVEMSAATSKQLLSIREKSGSVYVEGLSKYPVSSLQDLWEILARGDQSRSTAATNMNETSSRSHAVLMLTLIIPDDSSSSQATGSGTHRESTIMLVDLAGSERAAASSGRDQMRLEEAKSINLSLSALGNCMSALAEGRAHIPYRDSKLTRLLQGCLGGSARTAVIVNLPPGEDSTGEILGALRFASRASKVKVVAKVNRCKDYEAMYLEAKRSLETLERASSASRDEAIRTENEAELQKRDAVIDKQASEIESLRKQLAIFQASAKFASDTAAAESNLTDVDESVWAKRLADQAAQHASEVNAITKINQVRLDQLKSAERLLAQEISGLHDELTAARQGLLAALQDARLQQEKRTKCENELQGRVEELLEELTEKRSLIDTLQDSARALESRATESESKLAEALLGMSEMVSKDQVREMEGLFVDTVTKLSNRVNFLESQSKSAQSVATLVQQVNQQQYQPSSNNTSRIKIEPGGKIRALSLSQHGDSAASRTNASGLQQISAKTIQQSTSYERLNSSTSATTNSNNSNIGNNNATNSGGAVGNKLW